MLRSLRNLVVVVLPFAIGLFASPAGAAQRTCGNPSQSAINQYCETLPGATGAQTPSAGGPSLASTLPSKIVHQITGSGSSASGSTGSAASHATGSGSQGSRGRSSARDALASRKSAAARTAERRRLLTLPAPAGHPGSTQLKGSVASTGSLFTWPIILLAGVALALAVTAAARRRRGQRPGS